MQQILLLLKARCWPCTALIVKGNNVVLRIPETGYEAHPHKIQQVLVIDDPSYVGEASARKKYQTSWDDYVRAWKNSARANGATS